jgi:hypothetical protein
MLITDLDFSMTKIPIKSTHAMMIAMETILFLLKKEVSCSLLKE